MKRLKEIEKKIEKDWQRLKKIDKKEILKSSFLSISGSLCLVTYLCQPIYWTIWQQYHKYINPMRFHLCRGNFLKSLWILDNLVLDCRPNWTEVYYMSNLNSNCLPLLMWCEKFKILCDWSVCKVWSFQRENYRKFPPHW